VFFQEFMHICASRASLVRQICQSPDFFLTETQFPAAQNELQPLPVYIVVAAITIRRTDRQR
jgi:hypothetical protein